LKRVVGRERKRCGKKVNEQPHNQGLGASGCTTSSQVNVSQTQGKKNLRLLRRGKKLGRQSQSKNPDPILKGRQGDLLRIRANLQRGATALEGNRGEKEKNVRKKLGGGLQSQLGLEEIQRLKEPRQKNTGIQG